MDTSPNPCGFCVQCGYALQGLPKAEAGYRCPECGQPFDPLDPKTFHADRHSQLLHRLATPAGWPAPILCLIAAAAMLLITRCRTFAPSTSALVHYLHPSALRHRTSAVTLRDVIFTVSMLAAIAGTGWWVMRSALRAFSHWRMSSPQEDHSVSLGKRGTVLVLSLILVFALAGLGWRHQLAQNWVARRTKASLKRSQTSWWLPLVAPPASLSQVETEETLRTAIMDLPQVKQRMTGLQILMEDYLTWALPILSKAVSQESDSEVRALELRLIGLHRSLETVDLLRAFLTHPESESRAAAADALGLLHAPPFEVPPGASSFSNVETLATTGQVSINLQSFVRLHSVKLNGWPWNLSMNTISLDSSIRDSLEQLMLSGQTVDEREAAARALLRWPPEPYKLRVAEWGVWIDDAGQLKLIQSVLDEIPPFVHRTGNPLTEFQGRVNPITIVTKPIIHITVDRPLAVDVNVVINRGRPWFAYPRPDDFAVQVEPVHGTTQPLSPLAKPELTELADVRQGYPWLTPKHVASGSISGSLGVHNDLTGLGLRWQSIIASPTQLSWMSPPEVGPDKRFAWWSRLREVPTAWLSSRGETERFLYYDGPTLAPPPFKLTLKGNQLNVEWAAEPPVKPLDPYARPVPPLPKPPAVTRGILLVHHLGGRLTGHTIQSPIGWHADRRFLEQTLGADDLHDEQVTDEFRSMLQAQGLTSSEAEGLIASWQQQFFRTKGTRLLLLMSRADYDTLCPIEIRPTPTEMTRVGIILMELGDQ